MGWHFPVRERSGKFEQTGTDREKSHKILEKSGEFQTSILLLFFNDIVTRYLVTVDYLLQWIDFFSYKNKTF